MIYEALYAFWFFLPAGVANMAPVLFNRIPGWKKLDAPMDFGKSWRSKRIFGDNKQWRGLLAGIVGGALVGWLTYPNLLAFSSFESVTFGSLIGFGALFGDALGSFFKRQIGVRPGESWFPFDQIDYIVGGVLSSLVFLKLQLITYLLIFVIYFGLHLLVTYAGHKLGFKDRPI